MSTAAPLHPSLAPKPPPTMADLPYDDGEPMESPKHLHQMSLLIETLQGHLADRNDVFIGGNMGVYYSALQAVKNEFKAPDFFVVLGVPYRERTSWVVWEEECGPNLVIELLSESTAANDRGHKKTIYARALHVPEYYLFDPHKLTLEGFELDNGSMSYREMPKAAAGGYRSGVLGLELVIARGKYRGVETEWLRWARPDGTIVPTQAELVEAQTRLTEAEKQRAEAEKQRAEAEKQRAEAEKQRAEAEKQRAEAEKQRAEAEKQRAERLAEQLRAAGLLPVE